MNLRSGHKTIRDGGEGPAVEQGDDTTTPAQSKHKYDDGSVYEGGWKGGVRHGRGKLTTACGSVYEGVWKSGALHGQGTLTKASGWIFEGMWVDDKLVQGTRKSPDGESYEGEFNKAGLPHGKGTEICADGSVYDGEWKEDDRHGKGNYTHFNGATYEGEWKLGLIHGKGTYKWICGRVYEGEWKEGKRHGKGTFTYCDGEVYEGDWKNDNRHGKGRHMYVGGHIYEGDYRDGQLHGTGVLKHADGWSYAGEYQNGFMHGRGTHTNAKGSVYEGEYRDDKKHGYGTFKTGGIEFKRRYKDGKLVSSKRVATLISGSLVDGPPSQRPRIDRDVEQMFLLTEEDTQCEICLEEFASDRNAEDESIRKRLPVLSKTCDHFFCHGCILKQQQSLANKKKNGPPPQWIKCMKCRKENAFCPGEPWYDRRLINMLNECIPVRGLWSTNAMERDATKAGSLADVQK
ncbi:hypothetical protein ACHAXT_005628 [Thalassiosira profunda]